MKKEKSTMIETIWKKIRENEGSLFHTLGKGHLELRYRMIDENHLTFSRTAETVSKDAFQKVLGLLGTLTPAQINKQIRASYYILAVLQDKRIRTE